MWCVCAFVKIKLKKKKLRDEEVKSSQKQSPKIQIQHFVFECAEIREATHK